MFFSIKITLTRGICFWQPYQTFSKINPQLLSPEVRDCEAYILNRSPFQNLLLGRRNAQMKSLLETYRSQSEKFFSKSGKIGDFCTSKNIFFLDFILRIRWRLFDSFAGNSSGKVWNFLYQSQKKIRKNFFYASFVPSEYTSRHFPTEFLRNFSWKSESVEFLFRNKVLAECSSGHVECSFDEFLKFLDLIP